MPLGRKKVPFSGKAKKLQLQAKKQGKNAPPNDTGTRAKTLLSWQSSDDDEPTRAVQKLNHQPSSHGRSNPNRFTLQFHRESEAELEERKEEALRALSTVPKEDIEVDVDRYFPEGLKFPVRPDWDSSMSRTMLDMTENRYFTEYLKDIERRYPPKELSYFELNLETWRQLWRVMEMADIALVVTDIRFPALSFPPFLFDYISKTLGKEVILVLNKIDLVPASLVVAWKCYLQKRFPGLHIVMFTSFPLYNLRQTSNKKTGLRVRRCKGKMKMTVEGAQTLYNACKDIVKNEVDITSWQHKINEEMSTSAYDDGEVVIGETINLKRQDTKFKDYSRFESGILTIGCIGQPNVGKSSLINALMGKKVVSVSRTPGHTKHFQTIFLTPSVRLCDCPGLVFPSLVPKRVQALIGSYPIAQLSDPYSSVKYIAERTDLVNILKLEHPDKEEEWTAMDISDAWANKKGFFTARAARPDKYRAANHLLRLTLDGKIPFYFAPPDYHANLDEWEKHPEARTVKWIQDVNEEPVSEVAQISECESSDDTSSAAGSFNTNRFSSDASDSAGDEESGQDSDNFTANKFQALNTSK